jgi:hypothetical protein
MMHGMSRTTVVAGMLLGMCATARADLEVRASYSHTAGVTDNALSAPEPPPPGNQGPGADVFTALSPGIAVLSINPRSTQELAYRFNIELYNQHRDAANFTHRLSWDGTFAPSPASELLAGALIATGRISTYDLALAESGALRPPGVQSFLRASAREQLNLQLRPAWSLEQIATATAAMSLDDPPTSPDDPPQTPTTTEVATATTAVHGDETSSRALTVRVAGAAAWHPADVMMPRGSETRMRVGVEGRWRKDLGESWNTELRAGVQGVFARDAYGGHSGPHPSGGGALQYIYDQGFAELVAQREVRTDLFYGFSYVAEEVGLNLRVPDGWIPEDFTLIGRTMFARTRAVSAPEDVPTHDNYILTGAAALGWRASEYVRLELGYAFLRQGNDDPMGTTLARQDVTLTAIVTYPSERPERRSEGPGPIPRRIDGADVSEGDSR